MKIRLEKALYQIKYTLGSYLDAGASLPIWMAEKVAKGLEHVLGERNPKFLSLEYIQDKSPIYKGREKLRESLDTRAGALYLQSNIIGALPFVFVGMPAAELAQSGINEYMAQSPEIVQYATNSLITLAAQMVAGYTTFMANEIRVNSEKYIEKGKYDLRKILIGLKKAIKTFLRFDLTYITLKLGGQSGLLAMGKDPWKASSIFDAFALPAYYTICIPLGLQGGLIETKATKEEKL